MNRVDDNLNNFWLIDRIDLVFFLDETSERELFDYVKTSRNILQVKSRIQPCSATNEKNVNRVDANCCNSWPNYRIHLVLFLFETLERGLSDYGLISENILRNEIGR